MSSLLILPLILPSFSTAAEVPALSVRVEHLREAGIAELIAEFDAAHAVYKTALSEEEDKKKKRALRKQKPAIDFYPKFQSLGESGEGRALMWMIENVRDAGFKKKEADGIKAELAGRLVREFVAADWFGDAAKLIIKEKRALGMELVEELATTIVAKSPDRIIQARTLADLAAVFERSKDEDESKKGTALFARLEKEYDEETLGQALSGSRFKSTFLRKGKVVPDFTTEDVDGAAFKLSDYRGQVVLIDFWGFW